MEIFGSGISLLSLEGVAETKSFEVGMSFIYSESSGLEVPDVSLLTLLCSFIPNSNMEPIAVATPLRLATTRGVGISVISSSIFIVDVESSTADSVVVVVVPVPLALTDVYGVSMVGLKE